MCIVGGVGVYTVFSQTHLLPSSESASMHLQESVATSSPTATTMATCDAKMLNFYTSSVTPKTLSLGDNDQVKAAIWNLSVSKDGESGNNYNYKGFAQTGEQTMFYIVPFGINLTPPAQTNISIYRAPTADLLAGRANPVLISTIPDSTGLNIGRFATFGDKLAYTLDSPGADNYEYSNDLYVIDASTGKVAWTNPHTLIAFATTSALYTFEVNSLKTQESLVRHNPDTGAVEWSIPFDTSKWTLGTVSQYGSGIYLTREGGNSPYITTSSDILKIDPLSGHILWAYPTSQSSSPLGVSGDKLYINHMDGTGNGTSIDIITLNDATGVQLDTATLPPEVVVTDPSVCEDNLYFVSDSIVGPGSSQELYRLNNQTSAVTVLKSVSSPPHLNLGN